MSDVSLVILILAPAIIAVIGTSAGAWVTYRAMSKTLDRFYLLPTTAQDSAPVTTSEIDDDEDLENEFRAAFGDLGDSVLDQDLLRLNLGPKDRDDPVVQEVMSTIKKAAVR